MSLLIVCVRLVKAKKFHYHTSKRYLVFLFSFRRTQFTVVRVFGPSEVDEINIVLIQLKHLHLLN